MFIKKGRTDEQKKADLDFVRETAVLAETVDLRNIPLFLKARQMRWVFGRMYGETIAAVAKTFEKAGYTEGSEMFYLTRAFRILSERKAAAA